ncbi:hypothetical protein L6452_09687 [Arctium lappa]|uniref:Uncharacterized protein n=1 Tax=Arctium lappa TaxID=4217 RepID=A0ACB9DLD6_ARCLA|nr:hypothetical protein L6452_09687 [Arctium lappa]
MKLDTHKSISQHWEKEGEGLQWQREIAGGHRSSITDVDIVEGKEAARRSSIPAMAGWSVSIAGRRRTDSDG